MNRDKAYELEDALAKLDDEAQAMVEMDALIVSADTEEERKYLLDQTQLSRRVISTSMQERVKAIQRMYQHDCWPALMAAWPAKPVPNEQPVKLVA